MNQKEREKILESFTKNQLLALEEVFKEEIKKISDLEMINSIEELIGKKVAIQVLKTIMRKLRLLKEKRSQKPPNEYI